MASVTFDSPGFSPKAEYASPLDAEFSRLSPRLQRALRIVGMVFTAAVLVEFGFRIVELFDGGSFAAGKRIAAAKFSRAANSADEPSIIKAIGTTSSPPVGRSRERCGWRSSAANRRSGATREPTSPPGSSNSCRESRSITSDFPS